MKEYDLLTRDGTWVKAEKSEKDMFTLEVTLEKQMVLLELFDNRSEEELEEASLAKTVETAKQIAEVLNKESGRRGEYAVLEQGGKIRVYYHCRYEPVEF